MPPKIRKADETLAEQYGFEISTPPEKAQTRKSKYDEVWAAARKFTMRNPGVTIKVRSDYGSLSNAYNNAKEINNGEHRAFSDDSSTFTAVAGKDTDAEGTEQICVWLTYNGERVE